LSPDEAKPYLRTGAGILRRFRCGNTRLASAGYADTGLKAAGAEPRLSPGADAGGRVIALSGDWVMANARAAEGALGALSFQDGAPVVLDLSQVGRLDTLGSLLVANIRAKAKEHGAAVTLRGATPDQLLLIAEVQAQPDTTPKERPFSGVDILVDVGKGMHGFGSDFVGGVSFLGGFMAALGRVIVRPSHFRTAAFVKQLEAFGFRSVPIIALISFLVGGIIAQQSVFQLRTFGTAAFVADLLGILVLRELGVLLTAIMIAGRSGSAITAEIGSMKMREEIDALRTMGLDPMEVLIVPRILALIVAMPILTFIASMSGIFGGGLVAWVYGDVSPDVFLARLQGAVRMNTFMVGMIKAPVMALVIGLIAAIEGAAVQGSAESLGRQTTASVVKAIFMVILVDGLFAMFFAAIKY
jgi:phospholipid/cholesterol/gamma-HCH transport system permease protein